MMTLPQPRAAEPPDAYRNGSTSNPSNYPNGTPRPPSWTDRQVIAWDMEGMSLSGDDMPQHPVLFGCSAEPEAALTGRCLSTLDMLTILIETARARPHSIHVGYHFQYDANMILKDLPRWAISRLWTKNRVRFQLGRYHWIVQWYPGKKLTVTRSAAMLATRRSAKSDYTSVTVHDYSSFFGGAAFLKTCEQILRGDLSEFDRETIGHGKDARGSNEWDDMAGVRHYWEREIQLIRRVFERFKSVMVQAGFPLREWYGPGALANFINSSYGLRPHIAAAQESSGHMPDQVHQASKIAFSGGRFEAFQIGYTAGPVYGIDINSAYPHALTMLPSMDPAHGRWEHVVRPESVALMGIYRVEFHAPRSQPVEHRPMPLFHRDGRGLITYPSHVHTWAYSPEVSVMRDLPGVTVHEGWEWRTDSEEKPWEFLRDMYQKRMRLGRGNLLSMPFKLGPNSLYGKYAQTVGWDERTFQPPRWHALPIAGWVTSMCRAKLWDVIQQIPDQVIAVETDSVYTTVHPDKLGIRIGGELGEWSMDEYEALLYLQSGMYLTKREGEWTGVRSRGISRKEFQAGNVLDYVRGLEPGSEWGRHSVAGKPRFVGMGAALSGKDFSKWRTWRAQPKDISLGDSGKRRHHHVFCRACQDGVRPIDGPHRTFIGSMADGTVMSQPRALPWEIAYSEQVERLRLDKQLTLELGG